MRIRKRFGNNSLRLRYWWVCAHVRRARRISSRFPYRGICFMAVVRRVWPMTATVLAADGCDTHVASTRREP